MAESHVFQSQALERAVAAIVAAGGSEPREAQLVSSNLVMANLSGHDSHGVGMIPRYVESLQEGGLQPNRHPRVKLDGGALLALDGQAGYGQVIGMVSVGFLEDTVSASIGEAVPILALSTMLALAFGTFGYAAIEGWSAFDALYMTVITLATVGFQEVHELSTAGRAFTLVLIIFGAGIIAYAVGSLIQLMVEGQLRDILGRKKLEKQINKLREHYIICGYCRI